MIRQTMELGTPCSERSCNTCRNQRSAEYREQLMAMAAAVAFLLCGLGVILLDGGLLIAVLVGLLAGACAMVLTALAVNQVEKRRLTMCGDT